MLGGQSRALIIASKLQGWDPTKIAPGGQSVANFDKDPSDPFTHKTTGDLPGGSPDAWPDGYSMGGLRLGPNDPVSFRTPDVSRETARRATIDGNPAPASPGVRERSNERGTK